MNQSFEALWRQNEAKVANFCLGLTRHREDAEDLLSETRLKAFKSFDDYNQSKRFIVWCCTIAKRAWLDVLRRRVRRPSAISIDEPVEGEGGELWHDVIDPARSAEDELCSLAGCEEIEATVGPDAMKLLVLLEIVGLRYDETSKYTTINIGTVRSRKHRYRRRAQMALSPLKGRL